MWFHTHFWYTPLESLCIESLKSHKVYEVSLMLPSQLVWWKKYVKRACIWVPWKGIDPAQVFRPQIIGNRSIFGVNMGWERILSLNFYGSFKTLKFCDFSLSNVMSTSRHVEKPLEYHTYTTLMWNCFKSTEMGIVYYT